MARIGLTVSAAEQLLRIVSYGGRHDLHTARYTTLDSWVV